MAGRGMDETVERSVYEILGTMGEALEHLRQREDESLRQLVAGGRRQVTEALEQAMACSLELRIGASKLPDEDWLRTAYLIAGEISEPFQPKNSFDREFRLLLEYVWGNSEQELLENMKMILEKKRRSAPELYGEFVSYFARFPLWGTLEPDRGDYGTLELRAAVLKRHSYDFLWLYCRLEDYLSRRTLYGILKNWAILDMDELGRVRSIFPDYWEPDIFPDNDGDVLVDVGAYVGDSLKQYVETYGMGYRRIYAYEISLESYGQLSRNAAAMKLHDTVLRRKGAGRAHGEMFVSSSASIASANQLSREGGVQARVEVVPLDEDIQDEVTFLKMDIEGAEQDALLGSERMIRSLHPKLAICTYHGYEDIWKIPLMIDGMYPEYQFYLRHYGGCLIPTEFVLLCKP